LHVALAATAALRSPCLLNQRPSVYLAARFPPSWQVPPSLARLLAQRLPSLPYFGRPPGLSRAATRLADPWTPSHAPPLRASATPSPVPFSSPPAPPSFPPNSLSPALLLRRPALESQRKLLRAVCLIPFFPPLRIRWSSGLVLLCSLLFLGHRSRLLFPDSVLLTPT
jgi:hypothetical protein